MIEQDIVLVLGGPSPVNPGKDAWDILGIIGRLSIPVVIFVATWLITAAIRARQRSEKLVELALGILRRDPQKTPIPGLRNWAADVISRYSGVQLSAEARREIAESSVAVDTATSIEKRLDRLEDVLLRHGLKETGSPLRITETEVREWLNGFPTGEYVFPYDYDDFQVPSDHSRSGEIGILHRIVQIIDVQIGKATPVAIEAGQWGPDPDPDDQVSAIDNRVSILAQCETKFHPQLQATLWGPELPTDPKQVIDALRQLDDSESRFETGIYRLTLGVVQGGLNRKVFDVTDCDYVRMDAGAVSDKTTVKPQATKLKVQSDQAD